MSVDTASSAPSSFDTASFDTSTVHCSAYPSEQDLSRLARALRSAARDRGLPDQITERYEAWIYLFLGWSLQAPPGRVHRDRVGDFWTALTHRQLPRWKICEAMDAIGFLFGALGGPEGLSVSGSASVERAEEGSNEANNSEPDAGRKDTSSTTAAPRKNPYRPNPTLHASPSKREAGSERPSRNLSSYLPEGQLPMGVDARAVVPTADPNRAQASAPASSEDSDSREGSGSPEERAPGGSLSGPRTLFNPEGSAGDGNPNAGSPETLFPQDDPPKGTEASEGKRSSKSYQDRADDTAAQKEVRSGHLGSTEASAPPEEEVVSLPIPESVAERVRKAARQLGLPPQVFVARALDLVCDEAGGERSDSPVSEAPLDRYQAQLDVLHLGERSGPIDPEGTDEREGTDRSQGTAEPPERSGSIGNDSSAEKDGSVGKDGSVRERPFLSL